MKKEKGEKRETIERLTNRKPQTKERETKTKVRRDRDTEKSNLQTRQKRGVKER